MNALLGNSLPDFHAFAEVSEQISFALHTADLPPPECCLSIGVNEGGSLLDEAVAGLDGRRGGRANEFQAPPGPGGRRRAVAMPFHFLACYI